MGAPRPEALGAFYPVYFPTIYNLQTGAVISYGGILNSVTVAGATSATAGSIPTPVGPAGSAADFSQIQIFNNSTSVSYVAFGIAGNVTAAVATSYPVAAGATVVVTVHPEVTGVSVIQGTANGNVIFTRGVGL